MIACINTTEPTGRRPLPPTQPADRAIKVRLIKWFGADRAAQTHHFNPSIRLEVKFTDSAFTPTIRSNTHN